MPRDLLAEITGTARQLLGRLSACTADRNIAGTINLTYDELLVARRHVQEALETLEGIAGGRECLCTGSP